MRSLHIMCMCIHILLTTVYIHKQYILWLHSSLILRENSMHPALSVCVSDHGHGFHWNILKPWDALKCPSPPSRLPSLVFPLEVFRLPGKWSANIETSTCNMNYPIIPRRLWGQGVAATHILKKFWSWWKETPIAFDFPHIFFGLRPASQKRLVDF